MIRGQEHRRAPLLEQFRKPTGILEDPLFEERVFLSNAFLFTPNRNLGVRVTAERSWKPTF